MSSSVIRRNAQLATLDEKFEQFFGEYDEMNVGGLELDSIEGTRNPEVANKEAHPGDLVMKQVLEEFQETKATERQTLSDAVAEKSDIPSVYAAETSSKNPDKEIIKYS